MRFTIENMDHLARRVSIIIVLTVALGAPALAESVETIVLQNVSLMARDAEQGAKLVHLRIVAGQLELVSEGEVPAEPGDVVYDARRGFVLGQLKLGEPANFLILDADPREDMQALLDTRTYATFAVEQGKTVRNRLCPERAAKRDPEDTVRWLAYTPPPFAVPLDVLGTERWNRYEGKWGSAIFIAGIGIERTTWLDQDGNSRLQVGELGEFDGGLVRGVRYGGVGTIKTFERPWVWTLFAQTNAFDKGVDVDDLDDLVVLDVRLDIPLSERFTLSVGKQKPPISMERLMAIGNWPRQERAAHLDAFLPARKIGALVHGTVLDQRVTVAGGLFNSWLDRGQDGGISDNPTSVGGRVTWVAFESDDEATLLHLGAAARYSNMRGGARVSETPEVVQAPYFVELPFLEGDRLTQRQAEVSFRTGALWLHSEFLRNDVEGTPFGDLTFDGYHVMASYALTGEMRPYLHRSGIFRRLPVARSVKQNGWGAWEVSTRFSHMDLSDGGLDGGVMDIWSSGVNWWPTSVASIGLTYNHIELDRFGVRGTSHMINARLVLMLE